MTDLPKSISQRSAFVVRIWWEEDVTGQRTWQGWAQHAATGSKCYFHDVTDLLAFIEDHTGPLAQRITSPRYPLK